jgi:hypothetical protein
MSERPFPSLSALLAERVGSKRVVVVDEECVDTAAHYEPFLKALIQGAGNGLVALTHFEAKEGSPRRLAVGINGREPISIEVEGDTDWVDAGAVIRGLNQALGAQGISHQWVWFHGPEFGQESGWALLTTKEIREILDYGEEHGEYLQVMFGAGWLIEEVAIELERQLGRVVECAWDEARVLLENAPR